MEETRKVGKSLFAFLSYTHASSTRALSIFHSLIFQLASEDDDLQTIVCESSREVLKTNVEVAANLFAKLLACAGMVYVVVDGLDEIKELERGLFLKHLLAIVQDAEYLRVCISSRPEADLKTYLVDKAETVRVDTQNAGSIQKFVNHQTQKWLYDRSASPAAADMIQRLLAPLAWKSKGGFRATQRDLGHNFNGIAGMFLYAKVILSSLEYLDDISEIESELQVLPEDLHAA